jgi:quinone-modifying oxidoreductase subunit QmoC
MLEVRPDIPFIEDLQQATGSRLTTCMQCGACTAACSLSEEGNVFPRKQMIMAAWGMKERLMADPNVWTCHQCGDCTLTCPRGVKPGEILAGLRRFQLTHYARPGFLSRWMQDIRYLPLLILLPALIIVAILLWAGTFTLDDFSLPEGPVNYGEFFPHGWLNGSFTFLFALSALAGIRGISAYWKQMKNQPGEHASRQRLTFRNYWKVIRRILVHRDFNRCTVHKSRSLSHLLVFWGFIMLLFVTFFAILSTIFFEYPLDILDPVKIAGNIGALCLLTGSSLMILHRITHGNSLASGYADWFFLISFWLLTLSGILVEAARFYQWGPAYHLYFGHLVLVWIIILYLPYTKFAHFLYRTTALLYLELQESAQSVKIKSGKSTQG